MWQIQNNCDPEATNRTLQGRWEIGDDSWTCTATGGAAGITLGDPDSPLCLRVASVGNDVLPVAGEQYVRGDAWKIQFPQESGQYSLRLSLRVVAASTTRMVWEPTFSIQTSLLDAAPSLELTALGHSDIRVAATAAHAAPGVSMSGITVPGGGQLIVLLGPHDAPFVKQRSSRNRLDLRIFGEFLEKGVIRKTRPWVIFDRSEAGVSAEELTNYCQQMSDTPLPLTA
jgi:hypothetical protein